MGSLILTEPYWTGYCKLNCQVVRIKVSFSFLKVFPDVKLSFINFFSSGIKSVFCTAAWSKLLWPNIGISEGGDLSWVLSCLLEPHFKKPGKSLLLRQTVPDLTLRLCWERTVAVWLKSGLIVIWLFGCFLLLYFSYAERLQRCSETFVEIKPSFRTWERIGTMFATTGFAICYRYFNCSLRNLWYEHSYFLADCLHF